MLDPRRVPDHTSHVVHVGNLLLVPMRSKQTLTPGRSLGDRRQTGSTVVLGHLIPLPHDRLRVMERGFAQVVAQLHHLTGPIYQHAIGIFNACSRGLTHWSLTDTSGGYNLGGADFLHTTPWPSQPMVSTFHLRAPPSLRLSIQHKPLAIKSKTPSRRVASMPLDLYRAYNYT
jgi:hypothetical protein